MAFHCTIYWYQKLHSVLGFLKELVMLRYVFKHNLSHKNQMIDFLKYCDMKISYILVEHNYTSACTVSVA